jgi:hypothetical protein
MAINFPSTAGQATDGSYTYNVAGIIYVWNGSSWEAAGAGASATDRTLFSVTNASAGSTSLSYNNSNGVFTYTPPNLSGYLTAEADTLDTVTGRGATTTNTVQVGRLDIGGTSQTILPSGTNDITFQNTFTGGAILLRAAGDVEIQSYQGSSLLKTNTSAGTTGGIKLYYATGLTTEVERLATTSTGVTINGVLTAGSLTYPSTNGTSGQVLTSDGAGGVTWTAGGLQSRTTASVTQSIANAGSSDVSITTPSGYALLSIATSHAAWVTLYSDTTSRTNDSTRAITNDPLPGSGVLAEVITTGNTTQLITPGVICFNSGGAGQNTTYAKIVNRSGSTNNIQVTLTYITIEA